MLDEKEVVKKMEEMGRWSVETANEEFEKITKLLNAFSLEVDQHTSSSLKRVLRVGIAYPLLKPEVGTISKREEELINMMIEIRECHRRLELAALFLQSPQKQEVIDE